MCAHAVVVVCACVPMCVYLTVDVFRSLGEQQLNDIVVSQFCRQVKTGGALDVLRGEGDADYAVSKRQRPTPNPSATPPATQTRNPSDAHFPRDMFNHALDELTLEIERIFFN